MIRHPLLWTLLWCAAIAIGVMLEQRRRRRVTWLDRFAEERGFACVRHPDLDAITTFEPLALVPPVVAIERLLHARAGEGPLAFACLVGNRHRPLRCLVVICAGPHWLPPLRVLPRGYAMAPESLGFVEVASSLLPAGLRLESFDPPPREVEEVLARLLADEASGRYAIELRPGRLILASETVTEAGLIGLLAIAGRAAATLSAPPSDGGESAPGP